MPVPPLVVEEDVRQRRPRATGRPRSSQTPSTGARGRAPSRPRRAPRASRAPTVEDDLADIVERGAELHLDTRSSSHPSRACDRHRCRADPRRVLAELRVAGGHRRAEDVIRPTDMTGSRDAARIPSRRICRDACRRASRDCCRRAPGRARAGGRRAADRCRFRDRGRARRRCSGRVPRRGVRGRPARRWARTAGCSPARRRRACRAAERRGGRATRARDDAVGFLAPLADPEGIARLRAAGVVAFAMESIPRITRAQSMDALSSQATVSGYKAVLLAADRVQKMFPAADDGGRARSPPRALSCWARAWPGCRRSRPRGGSAPSCRRSTCVRR